MSDIGEVFQQMSDAAAQNKKCRHDVSQDCPACMQETIDRMMKALRLARNRIEYLGAACNDPKHFIANADTFLPAIDEALGDVGGPGTS